MDDDSGAQARSAGADGVASEPTATTAASTTPTPVLQACGLEHSYRMGAQRVPSLRGVTLSIWPGQLVVLTGPSGSGKSTLVHLLSGIDRPDRGEVLLNGSNLSQMSDREQTLCRRRHIGLVFQSFHLMSTLAAVENVALPLLLDHRRDAMTRATKSLQQVGLGHRLKHTPLQLSGGEQQRVAIARALVTDPSVILADEPTGALDSASGREVISLLHQVALSGHAVVLVTHDDRWTQFAHRVVHLLDGRVEDDDQASG